MRASVYLLVTPFILVAAACGDGSGSDSPTATSTPPAATATLAPLSGLQILERSDAAMNELRSVRTRGSVRPAVAPEQNFSYVVEAQYAAPDRSHSVQRSLDGTLQQEAVTIGADVWYRTGLRGWQRTAERSPLAWPAFERAVVQQADPSGPGYVSLPPVITSVEEDERHGTPVWVMRYTYEAPSHEGPFDVFVTEWIEKTTYRLLRSEQTDNDPFGVQASVTEEYLDFDAPVTITPPASE